MNDNHFDDSPKENRPGNDDALSEIVQRLRLNAGIFTEAEYCGNWAVDTSGSKMATFHLVQQGDCWLLMAGEQPRALNPGDFVFLPRDATHLICGSDRLPPDVVINQPAEVLPELPLTRILCGYFEFHSSAQWPLLDALPEVVVLAAAEAGGTSSRIIDLILAECNSAGPGRQAALQQLSYLLFIQILREALSSGISTGLLAALNDPHIGQALGCMHRRPEYPWRLEGLAREVGMSRSAFAARFRQLVGQSAMQYLLAWRMQVAVDLLTTTDAGMGSIAEAVGYASEAAFRNAFASHMGQPPARVRRAARE